MANKKRSLKERLLKREKLLEKKEKRTRRVVFSLAFISIIGFTASLLFLAGITGGAVGSARSNLYGLIFIVASLLIWAVAEVIWLKSKTKKEIDVKKLIEELKEEGFPMIYSRHLVR